MQKQILKNEASLKKVAEWVERCLNWEFVHNDKILKLLFLREKILEKTRRKLIKMNRKSLVSWENPDFAAI